VRAALADLTFLRVVRRLPVAVRLDAPSVFEHADHGVLAWQVGLSDELQAIHRMVHEAAGRGADAAHTTPGEWMPHVTLARRLRLTALSEALASIGSPVTGRAVALRRWNSVTRKVASLEAS
jgi:2'-5' RNA ligase